MCPVGEKGSHGNARGEAHSSKKGSWKQEDHSTLRRCQKYGSQLQIALTQAAPAAAKSTGRRSIPRLSVGDLKHGQTPASCLCDPESKCQCTVLCAQTKWLPCDESSAITIVGKKSADTRAKGWHWVHYRLSREGRGVHASILG